MVRCLLKEGSNLISQGERIANLANIVNLTEHCHLERKFEEFFYKNVCRDYVFLLYIKHVYIKTDIKK